VFLNDRGSTCVEIGHDQISPLNNYNSQISTTSSLIISRPGMLIMNIHRLKSEKYHHLGQQLLPEDALDGFG